MNATTKTHDHKRDPKPGYKPHDHCTEWQECDTCGLRLGAGIESEHNAAYHAGNPDDCPACKDGLMCLPVDA